MLLRHHSRFLDRIFCSADGAAGGAGGAGGAAGGGGANSGASAGGDPWYQPHVQKIDKDTLAWLDGKKFGTLEDALKSGAQADKMARDRNVIARPDPAKLNEWDGWSALGWEADAGKYKAAVKPPKMPNGAQHDAELMDHALGLLHGEHVAGASAERIYHGLTDFVNKRLEAIAGQGARANEQLEETLRGEWKENYDINREIAQRAARTLKIGADDMAELEKVIGSPRLMKLFHQLGTTALEGKLVNPDGTTPAGGMTPAAAEAELRRLEADKEWLKGFTNSQHPQHADFKARHLELVAIVAKGKKAA